MSSYKISHKFYSAWNYGQEIADLNRASEQGWQLVKGGCFSSRFQKNPDIQYRYQLDFQKVADMGRYIETFREQGWEYISSTFNGWHYFRKFYDPALPESAYEIFTDRESLEEMRLRWSKIAMAIGSVLGIFGVLSLIRVFLRPSLPPLVQTLTLFLECAILLRGVLIMRNPEHNHKRKGDSLLLYLFFTVILAGSVLGIALTELRPNLSTEQQWDQSDTPADMDGEEWLSFDIRYTDYYYLDLSIAADQPLTFSIMGADGAAAYTKTSDRFMGEKIRLRLRSGQYWFRLSDYGSGKVHIKCSIG